MGRFAFLMLLLAGVLGAGPVSAQWHPTAGHLQPFGGYLTPLRGGTVDVLSDGSVLAYGYGMSANEWRAEQDQNDALRLRHGMESGPDPSPKLYDPAAGGWVRVPRAPQCPDGHVYLHTSTVLADGRLLIAGGLCDVAQALNDSAPYPPYAGMSIWDPLKRQWQSAPALAQTRIFHTATRMPDGSVLLIGGESDPQLPHDGSGVLASVVRYAGGKLVAAPRMATARAKHSATALSDGSVLVLGGLDDANHPLASAELLDARGQAWRTLPPMHVARYAHTATLLADGRVLVAGGMGEDGRPLRSVELWDPRSGAWSEGAELPVGLYGHAAVRLASGAVLVAGGTWLQPVQGQSSPWAWLWDPHSQGWQLAGTTSPSVGNDAPQPLGMVARSDGSALIFTANGVLRWSPETPAADVPAWRSTPAIAALPGHRVIMVGYLADDFRGLPVARIWNARTDRWSSTGPLEADSAGHPAALALRSGDVLYVTMKSRHELQCHRWSAPINRWSGCGGATLQYLADSRPQLGLLPDGRAFALVNMHEAAVLNERTARWTIWRVDWHDKGITYGAPVHGQQPLATITDPTGRESFEINDAGARFVHADGWRATAMLWNAGTGWWDYVLMGRQMGADAQRLPDGCAISTYPVALYRPADARVFALSDPGFGSTSHVMAVLDDGPATAGRSLHLAHRRDEADRAAAFATGAAAVGGGAAWTAALQLGRHRQRQVGHPRLPGFVAGLSTVAPRRLAALARRLFAGRPVAGVWRAGHRADAVGAVAVDLRAPCAQGRLGTHGRGRTRDRQGDDDAEPTAMRAHRPVVVHAQKHHAAHRIARRRSLRDDPQRVRPALDRRLYRPLESAG